MNTHFVTYRPYSDKLFPDDLDRYEQFMEDKEEGIITGWSARKTFLPGDIAIFYMAQPLMTIVAIAVVDTEPYVEEIDSWADFSNPVFCDFYPALFLEKELPIKNVIARQPLIAKWWKTKPYQGIRRIDPAVAQVLFKEIGNSNPDLIENTDWLAEEMTIIMETPLPEPKITVASVIPPTTRKKTKTETKKKRWTSRSFSQFDWQEFEILVAVLFSHMKENSTVELTSPTADFGADVIITNNQTQQVQIVQCKRYLENKVSSVDMQKFTGAMKKFKATRGYFVTSSSFNRFALKFVEGMDDIELINGKQLVKLINQDDRLPTRKDFQQDPLSFLEV